jgi:ribosomal protein S18 acetylase RimI-like enzyme
MLLVIREYRSEDFARVFDMDGRASERRARKFEVVGLGGYYCYIAEDGDDNVVGFVIMKDFCDGKKSHYMEQINVAIKRRGVGRSLVTRVFEEIGPGGHISLCTDVGNNDAIRFYEAMGFRWSGFVHGYKKDEAKHWYTIDLK